MCSRHHGGDGGSNMAVQGDKVRDAAAEKLRPEAPLTSLRGVGEKLAAGLGAGLELRTVGDLVMCFPRRARPVREVSVPEVTDLGALGPHEGPGRKHAAGLAPRPAQPRHDRLGGRRYQRSSMFASSTNPT